MYRGHHGGEEFWYDGRIWRSKKARVNAKKYAAAWKKTPEGRKSMRISQRKRSGAIFRDKAQEEEVDDISITATHCNNCEICELTHYPEPRSKHTAHFDHSHETKLPRQIICQYCNTHEAYLKKKGKWKKDDPNFTRFALINGKPIYLLIK